MVFYILYSAIFLVYFFILPEACTPQVPNIGSQNTPSVNCSSSVLFTKAKFKAEVAQLNKLHTMAAKVLTLLLGFYVATMMRRWWQQISALPDVKPLAMTLNGLVLSTNIDPDRDLNLKKTILRYCMLSYTLLMVEVTKPSDIKSDKITRWFYNCFSCCKRTHDRKVPLVDSKFTTSQFLFEKSLIKANEESGFDGQDMSKHWWVPINWACKLVQTNLDLMKDAKEIIGQLNKFQCSLNSILEYHMNPLPALCAQAVHVICWGFLIFGTYASQSCDGQHRFYWIPILVSFQNTLEIV